MILAGLLLGIVSFYGNLLLYINLMKKDLFGNRTCDPEDPGSIPR